MRAEIDGHTVYLSEDQAPVVSLTINDLMDPSKIRGARSNTLRVIATKEGRQRLGGEFMAEADLFAAGYPELKIGEDSVNLFKSDVAPVLRSRNEIECIALGGNSKWFEFAKNTKLPAFDYGDTPVIDADRIENSWTDEEQFDYWPLINYGALTTMDETDNVSPTTFRPALRVHRLIADALASEGFTVRPRGTLTNIWKKLILLHPKAKLATSAVSDETGKLRDDNSTAIPTVAEIGNPPTLYAITNTATEPSGNFSFGEWTQPFLGSLRVQVNNLRIALDALSGNVDGKRFRLVLYNTATNAILKGNISDVVQPGQGDVYFNVLWEVASVTAGTTLHLGLQIDDDTGIAGTDIATGPDFNESCVEFTPYSATHPLAREEWEYNRRLWLSSAAPNISIAELFSAICLNLCLMVDTHEDGTINVWYEKEFMRKPAQGVATRDWTTRMDHSKAPEKKIHQNPIRIRYEWKDDSNDRYLELGKLYREGLGYGDGIVEFTNGIEKETVLKMPFAATVQVGNDAGFPIPAMLEEDLPSGENSYDFEPRLLIADGLINSSWTFNSEYRDGTAGDVMPLCYFEFFGRDFPALSFEGSYFQSGNKASGTLELFYQGRHRRMALPYLEAHMRIWDHELPDFDHGKPTLADDGSGPAWYYVQGIKNHAITKGRPTKTILVPLPTREADGLIDNPAIEYPPQPEDDVCFGLAAFSDDVAEVDRAVIAQDQASLEAEVGSGGVLVAGAGTGAANGTYTANGVTNGKNAYIMGGWQIFWFSGAWWISDGSLHYKSFDDTAEPYQATTWVANTAANPVPTVTNDVGTLFIGDTLLIRDHNTVTPGSGLFEIHTGDVATVVAAGTGEAGSMFTFTTPAVGTVHKSLEDDTYWIRGFELTTSIYSSNGGTGALSVDYFYPPQVPGGAPPEDLAIDPQSYETSVRVTFSGATADQCRTGILEFSGDGGGTWDDHTTGTFLDWSSNPPATVNCGWDIDADTLRIRWERSGHVQGYSQPITI